jgi:membrane protease YdiL (CAAX protease family)
MTKAPTDRRLRAEVLIVLGLSLGWSAIVSIWLYVEALLRPAPIASQTTTLHPSVSGVPVMDIIYQVLADGYKLVPVALAVYLLNDRAGRARERLGLIWRKGGGPSPWRDVGIGAGLAALIGLPGIGVYAIGRALGQSLKVNTNGLGDHWWTATLLILAALVAAVLEETIMVGYLVTRLREMRWKVAWIVAASAIIRGCYHLYQGWPMAIGNLVMGIVFVLVFLRTRRVGPLIVAHAILDLVSFVGPEIVPISWLVALHVA